MTTLSAQEATKPRRLHGEPRRGAGSTDTHRRALEHSLSHGMLRGMDADTALLYGCVDWYQYPHPAAGRQRQQ